MNLVTFKNKFVFIDLRNSYRKLKITLCVRVIFTLSTDSILVHMGIYRQVAMFHLPVGL